MKTHSYGFVVIFLVTSLCQAEDQRQPLFDKTPTEQQLLKHFDENGDGRLDGLELRRAVEARKKFEQQEKQTKKDSKPSSGNEQDSRKPSSGKKVKKEGVAQEKNKPNSGPANKKNKPLDPKLPDNVNGHRRPNTLDAEIEKKLKSNTSQRPASHDKFSTRSKSKESHSSGKSNRSKQNQPAKPSKFEHGKFSKTKETKGPPHQTKGPPHKPKN